jgi:flagellar motility protein MotE (MotC chaperone)
MTGPARFLPLTMTAMIVVLALKASVLVMTFRHNEGAFAPRLVTAAIAETVTTPQQAAGNPASAVDANPMSAASAGAAMTGPPISDAERATLLSLRQRRAQLDAREADLVTRETFLAASEQRLAARLRELKSLQDKLESLETARQERDAANWAGLVKVYESMKPADAAMIFNDLDMGVLLPVVDRMKETKAAAIMAAMDPVKARALTSSIAETRLVANSLTASPNASASGR